MDDKSHIITVSKGYHDLQGVPLDQSIAGEIVYVDNNNAGDLHKEKQTGVYEHVVEMRDDDVIVMSDELEEESESCYSSLEEETESTSTYRKFHTWDNAVCEHIQNMLDRWIIKLMKSESRRRTIVFRASQESLVDVRKLMMWKNICNL